MQLFDNSPNTEIAKLLLEADVYFDRSPLAAALSLLFLPNPFCFLETLTDRAANDVYVFKNGVACATQVYFDEASRLFKWDLVRKMHEEEGATVYARGLQRHSLQVRDLLATIQPYFSGKKLFANMFLSPSHATGLNAHFDPTEFVVIQLSGSKLWKFWDAPAPTVADPMLPPEVSKYCLEIERQTPPSVEFNLVPGDTLYVRQYAIHAPKTTDEPSLHITVGLAEPSLRDRLNRWQDESKTSQGSRPPAS